VSDQNQNASGPLIDFRIEDIWPILRKQRQVILLFMATVLGTTLVGSLLRTKEYRATSILHLSPKTGQEVAVSEVIDMNTRGYFEIQQFFRTQIQIINSRSVREEVIRRYEAMGYDDLKLAEGGAQALMGLATVVPEEQSQLIDVHVTHTDPERAAVLANLITKTYSDKNLEARRDASKEATDWLEEKLVEYETNVHESKRKLFEFMGATNTVDVEDRLGTLDAKMGSLNGSFGDVASRRVMLETTVNTHTRLLGQRNFQELARALNSELLDGLARDFTTAQADDADLAARYGDLHPKRLEQKARLDRIEANLEAEVKRMIAAEKSQLSVVRAQERNLDNAIDSTKEDMLDFQKRASDYDELKAELERNQKFYEKLSDRLEEVRLTARTQLNNVQIVDEAVPPERPSKPNIPMSMGIAFVVGLVGGVGLAFLREFVDDTISSQIDVSSYLKVPFLGLVPRLPDDARPEEADLWTHYQPRSSIAEAVRGLRAMIEMNPAGPPPRRLLVTSSVAREGKTSTTVRLGVAFAQMGKKVVLIDGDLRRPRLHKVFDADNSVGLTSYLIGAAGIDDLANTTVVPNLDAIYSGSGTDHPSELMSTPAMTDLLRLLDERYDIVILDTPPSLALSDAVTLSRYVDGIVLVVKEQSVSRAVVKQTVDTLKQVEAPILGVVLNNVNLQQGGSKYRYYYAYRDYYSTYIPEDPANRKPRPDEAAK
jgi:succinoglycan biosynthesis transport protein ExoP